MRKLVLQPPSSRELHAEARAELVLVGKPVMQDAVQDRRSAIGACLPVARTHIFPAPGAHPVPARNKGDAVAFHVITAYSTEEPAGSGLLVLFGVEIPTHP